MLSRGGAVHDGYVVRRFRDAMDDLPFSADNTRLRVIGMRLVALIEALLDGTDVRPNNDDDRRDDGEDTSECSVSSSSD